MPRSFLAIPRLAIDDRRLNSGDRDMLIVLCSLLNKENPDCCWPSKSYLEDRLGISEKTVKRQLKKLRSTEYISRPTANAGRKPGAIFINFDVQVPVGFLRCTPHPNGQLDPVEGDTDGTPDDVRGGHSCTPQDLGGDTDDPAEIPRGGHSCTPQDLGGDTDDPAEIPRGGHSCPVRGGHQSPPGSIKGSNYQGGDARAREAGKSSEPDQLAQPPPNQDFDPDQKNGQYPSAKVPVPEVLPDHWAEIAWAEFHEVDDIERRFMRFQNHYVDDEFTEAKWLGRWRNWLLADFDPVDQNPTSQTVNGRDPPQQHAKPRPVAIAFEHSFVDALAGPYEAHVRDHPGKLTLSSSGGLFVDDIRNLRDQIYDIASGKTEPPFGIDGGPAWDWSKIREILPDFKGFTAHADGGNQSTTEAAE